MTFDRKAARARCEAARLAVSAEECLRHGPDLLEMACEDLPAALDELDEKDAEIERLRGAMTEAVESLMEEAGYYPAQAGINILTAALEGRDSE
jgi:hypothetical protein